ncbi:MAG: Na(+)/H(+) antiporter subunit D [Balneolaceae bacterium]|nr:Na(+)/H(+) antiporter subunit D [Balneolaceae bacterium]MCH8547614.1 Na(+)/H(+) antiporter subunit D [Balneolaceae bacterium]
MITEFLTIPGVLILLGCFLLPLLPERVRSSVFLIFPVAALAFIMMRPDGYTITGAIGNYDLILFQMDELSRVFGLIFAITGLTAGIYAWHIKDLSQQVAALGYMGGALGVTFAGDLFTLIVYWELMAVTSTMLIWARGTRESDRAGMRYLIYHVLGGGLLFAGILWHFTQTGSLAVQTLEYEFTVANVLMLLGVGVNAAFIPLHTWLSDAYPKATITGTIFMAAFTTKTAVYVLIRLFPGWEILIWAGLAMTLYGIFYAVVCKDIREILSYHIISQVGYMVVAIGVGTDMALNGSAAHAYNNLLYKGLMFMAGGAVMYAAGTSRLAELGGLGKKMKWVFALYVVGGFSISGLPLFAGFISKGLIIDGAGYAGYEGVMLLLLLAGVGTFLSVGLKLPYFTWVYDAGNKIDLKPIPVNMYIAMGMSAFLCIFYGVFPNALYTFLPHEMDYNPYTIYHFVEIMQISLGTFVVFWYLREKLKGEIVMVLDLDWFYRKAAPATRTVFVNKVDRFYDLVEEGILATASWSAKVFKNPMTWLNPFTDKKNQASTYSPGMEVVMSFIMICFLAIAIFYFI